MSKINILPDEVVAKISAGEVVTDPVCVIKELIENSLDAGAGSVKIIIRDAGLSYIAVQDDGMGMAGDDLQKCFLPHATSKIKTLDDLSHINTLGFRGEALYSICQFARVKISSQEPEALSGNFVVVKGKEVVESGIIGMPRGTLVEVFDLFDLYPARKKFQKEKGKIVKEIINVVKTFAICHSNIDLSLFDDKKELLDYTKCPETTKRLSQQVIGADFDKYLPLNISNDVFEFTGFISRPDQAKPYPYNQYLFVNSRAIDPIFINKYIRLALGDLLDKSAYLPFVFFLKIKPEFVDVNVHPAKKEVRFNDDLGLFDLLVSEINKIATSADLTFIKKPDTSTWIFLSDYMDEIKALPVVCETNYFEKNSEIDFLQAGNLYIIYATDEGLVLLDQHAAHERVVYQKLLQAYEHSFKLFSMKTDVPLDFTQDERVRLSVHQPVLKSIGFIWDAKFVLKQAPAILFDKNIKRIILEILEDLENSALIEGISADSRTKRNLSYLACRSAIKAGESLTKEQIRELLFELSKLDLSYTCPHGRPLAVKIPFSEINKMFMR